MIGSRSAILVRAVVLGALTVLFSGPASGAVRSVGIGGFAVEHELVLPGSPEVIFDAMTGDILGWWDHTFSEQPVALTIEPKPGGGFYEIFDDDGNGALHATVIYADRGKLLRYAGPLGLAGTAIDLAISYSFEAQEGDTLVKVTVSGAGVVEPGLAEAVDGVWHHFLFEQLKPYVEAGRHLEGDE
jgi:Activator of Hsp90 ATPase homolog 1-like protein